MGTLWNRSGTVERYADDLRAVGAKAYFFQGGTINPFTVYRDSGQTSPHPHPVVADANGRWPDVFVPFIASYDVEVMSADNVQLTFSLQIPNPNPISTGDIISPDTIETGMIHAEFVNKERPGYVRLNGKTIGSDLSAGSEIASDTAKALFYYLYANLADDLAPVLPTPRVTVDDDWLANKTIQLPDCRAMLLIGLDDMGNTGTPRFTGLSFSVGSATRAGSVTGLNSATLTLANLPSHTHTGTTDPGGAHSHGLSGLTADNNASHAHIQLGTHAVSVASSPNLNHSHPFTQNAISVTSSFGNIGVGAIPYVSSVLYSGQLAPVDTGPIDLTHGHPGSTVTLSSSENTFTSDQTKNHQHDLSSGVISSADAHSHGFTTNLAPPAGQGGVAFNNLGISRLVTWYIKL
jgi:hypothetical protein